MQLRSFAVCCVFLAQASFGACAPNAFNPADPASEAYAANQVIRCLLRDGLCPQIQPNSISGLQLWLRADLLNLSDSAAVTMWPDASGNGHDASGGPSPTFKAATLQGLPVVRFSGAQYLDTTTFTQQPAVTAHTILAVFRTAGTTGETLLSNLDTVPTGRAQLSHSVTCPNHIISSVLSGLTICHSDVYVDEAWELFVLTWTLNTLTFHSMGTQTSSTNETATTGGGEWRVGASKTGASGWNGDLAELAMFNRALTTAERQSLECYFSKKFGLALETSPNCPY